MSKISKAFFDLQEQAEFYDMELDVETLELTAKKPRVKGKFKYWQDREEGDYLSDGVDDQGWE